ncbi:MAG: hypothetical protein ABIR70_08880 [Bryobacteraceae bacterium]
MSWSDDTRCLFCDGKLPLFRKLAQGQFCSKVHQEAYWKEQDQLAVQVLHRTHDALQAYKPAASIESILGPAATPAAEPKPFSGIVPELQRLQSQQAGPPIAPPTAAIVSADPVEYEAHPRASKPQRDLENPLRELNRLAGLLALHNARAVAPECASLPVPMAVIEPQLTVASPEWKPRIGQGFALGGMLGLQPIKPGGEFPVKRAADSVTFKIEPVRDAAHALTPQGDVLQQMEQDAFGMGKTLLAIAGPALAEASIRVRDTSEWVAFPALVVECPPVPEIALPSTGLLADNTLHALPVSTQARDWHAAIVGEIAALEVRTPHVAMEQVRLRDLAAGDPIVDLLTHGGCAPLFRLPMCEASGSLENPTNRPVSFQAFGPECSLRLPDAAARGLPPLEIRSRAHDLLPLHFAEPKPRGDLRLRPAFVAMPLQGEPLLPQSKLEPAKVKRNATDVPAGVLLKEGAGQEQSMRRMASGVVNFWNHAPRDLKILLFAVPVALGLAFHPSLPKVSVQAPQADAKAVTGRFQEVLDTQMASLRKGMSERAAVGLDENFRSGLDNWMSHSGSTAEWSFDQAGFVQPGRVALYQPSLGLSDYEFQFLGAIDKGALSWVTRAVDFQNYYVVKLVVVKPGPIPEMGVTRYAVIDGKAVDRVDTPVTFAARTDSLYRVSMVMEGDHYSLVIQGQMIDSWKESRLKRGGVGFFTNRGEQSRIGWVQITHQYDMLGRLFAYLAP